MSTTKTAELAKILVDTSYYGWLINYAQITKMICEKENIDFDEMWKFADEIHENLGNRPKMFPGIIGCLLYTSPSPRDRSVSRMPSSA